MEHTCKERWREPGLISLKRRQRGDLNAFYRYAVKGYKGDEASLFSGVYGNSMRGTGHKVEHSKFQFDARKEFLP